MTEQPTSPLDQLQQLSELMQSAANLHDWPRVTMLNERRNAILQRLTNIDAEHRPQLLALVESHNQLVRHVNRIQDSLTRQQAYLGISRRGVSRYLAVEKAGQP